MMKTIVPFKLFVCLAALAISVNLSAQTQGLVFNSYKLGTGTANTVGAVYYFSNVTNGVYARVSIDEEVGGAYVTKIDDNSGGLGYRNAFQPEIYIPRGSGDSYVQFSIKFYKNSDSSAVEMLEQVQATALDIDGNGTVKEYGEIGMNGGTATYRTGTLDISILQLLLNKFKGQNILGIERDGIDTTALGNMYTVTKSNVAAFTVKFGASRLLASGSANRQYSLYMKGFNYIETSTLPIKLESFNAYLVNSSKVDLKWVTAEEVNVSHFIVERSLDGKVFGEAGMVFAMGNSTTRVNYSIPDNISNVTSGIVYYRLRSVDIDGKEEYSETRVIRLSKQANNTIQIVAYPNPATSEIRVTIPASWQNKKVAYEVVAANGQVTKRMDNNSSSQTETLNISQLAPGFYIVRASCEGQTAQQKIIKN